GDHAGGLHRLHQAGGAVVADLEPALDPRDRGAAGLGDDLHRLVVQRVGLVARTATGLRQAGGAHRGAVVHRLRFVQHAFDVVRAAAALLEVLDDAVDLVIGDEGAVHALGHGGARRQVEHVAV